MENPKEKIYSILQKLAADLEIKGISFKVESPKDKTHGDFASNFAMSAYRFVAVATDSHVDELNWAKDKDHIWNNPYKAAQDMVQKIKDLYPEDLQDFEKIEVVAPGFINFYLSQKYLQNQVQKIIEKGSLYGSSEIGKGKTASVEFVSANPTGPLHIGNARGGPLGDTIANILSKVGYKVTREYLHNDVGGQVERLGEAIYFTIHPDQKAKDYEIQYQGEYIKELSQSVKESLGQEDLSEEEFIKKAASNAVSLMLTEILKDCEDMGIKYDVIRKESDLRKEVPQVLVKLKKFLKEKDGALWFAPNDDFLKDRETVVKKSNGDYTYFASDIAYHNEKMERNDLVIDIWGANHSGHVPRMQAVVKALGFEPNNLKLVLYQWIRLKRGSEVIKMSKRAGTFVTAREVLDEVGKDAFRFFLLTPRTQTHMDFDLELAKKKSAENPVFYVQYAYTRISSIFSKSQDYESANLSLLKAKEEIELIRKLLVFPYLVEDVAGNFEVNALTTYALELASFFHKFYEANQVISKDEDLTKARLALLKATQTTLKNTLDLLGVSAPEKM